MFGRNQWKVDRRIRARKQRRCLRPEPNGEQLGRLLEGLLPDDLIFSKISFHGNTKWLPRSLVYLALIWAWSESKALTDSYLEAARCCQATIGSFTPPTYQGFMRALVTWTPTLMGILQPLLHRKMQDIGGRFWRINGWVPIAFDGSRSTAPRSTANELAFCARNVGKGKTAKYRKKKTKGLRRRRNERVRPQPQAPQAWITMMWHMGLRLPWSWRLGPSNSSERAHVMEMLQQGKYPKKTLFCGDAGFVGFPLWSAILQRGDHFLVRVGANVSLLTEYADYELGQDGHVLCWPKAVQAQHAPLRLRLVKARVGNSKVYLLTSVLDNRQLTIAQMANFYEMRWGVEIEFRGLKQTLDRAKLRSRNDRRLLAELDWSILAMAVAELFALQEQLAPRPHKWPWKEVPRTPSKRSLAKTMRAIRGCVRRPYDTPEDHERLTTLLHQAVTDSYQRKRPKSARYRPPNPDRKPLGEPTVRQLNEKEIKTMRLIGQKSAA